MADTLTDEPVSLTGELRVVDDVAAAFRTLVTTTRFPSIALSGGSTAEACYRALADAPELEWRSVVVLFGDERFVPVEHEDSNEGMARRVLLDRIETGAIHSAAVGATPRAAAAAYDRLVRALGPVGLVHLGLGEDGHTASLFPGSPALEVADRMVVATGDDRHPHRRITFTYPAIAASPLVVFTVAGAEKRAAFAGVRRGDRSLPAARIRAERVVWLVDHDAAGP